MTTINRILVVDTTFLDAIFRLDILNKLNLFYSRLLIPVTVEREFLSKENRDRDQRYEFLSIAFSAWKWVQKCTTFDKSTIELIIAEPKIDAGEAEVMAQGDKLGREAHEPKNLFVVIDEKRGRDVAKKWSLNLTGTLYILALLSLHDYLNYDTSIKKLQQEGARYNQKAIQLALEKAKRDLSTGQIHFTN